MSKHVIVVSIDAMVCDDIEYAATLPAFAEIMANASIIRNVRTIYPSLTHPAHASIMTGCPPSVTGVTSNMIFDPEDPLRSPAPWYNHLSDLRCDTILHAAKRAGLTTAASSWPLTCSADVVDYLVPGALNVDFEGCEDAPLEVYRRLGASECLMDIIAEGVSRFGYRDEHPSVDELQAFCSSEIIKRYKPGLLLMHPSYVDARRHATGVFTDSVRQALAQTDRWLGMLIDATKEAGIYEDTDFVLLSDHGHIDIKRVISPNVYLCDAGYINANDEGELLSYDAFVKSVGASAQVYLARPEDNELYMGVYNLLLDMADEGIYGFERVYTVEETERLYGLSGKFSFVLEGDGYTAFGDHVERPSVRNFDISDYRFGRGTHGHLPAKGPQPLFIASGPSFKRGVMLDGGSVLNHAPTIAAAMGVDMPESYGSAVLDILAE